MSLRISHAFLVALLAVAGCVGERTLDIPSQRYLEAPPTVQVLVIELADEIPISVPKGCWIVRGTNVLKSKSTQPAVITARNGRVRIGGKDSGFAAVTMVPPEGGEILLDERGYPGQMSFLADGGKVSAMNVVDIEEYVAGVVAGEMPLSWDDDALCAQAVAARSYALYEKKQWAGKRAFDLYADERSQVYVGTTRNEKALRAASATRGVVLTDRWQLFPTYYHSACGGRTRKSSPDFKPDQFTPLAGVTCPFCSVKDTRWELALLEDEIRARAKIPAPLTRIKIEDLSYGGRVRVDYRDGSVTFTADAFRLLIGQKKLRSWKFDVTRSKGKWVFSGKGFGHGVGLCQWGACGMAEKGYGWPSILRFYYPGAEAVRVY